MVSSSLAGKVAFVTGADRNLGKAMAMALLRDGANVVATAMYDSMLSQFVEESGAPDRVLALEGDISKDDDRQQLVKAAVDRFGKIDVLVNNAAVTPETFWPNFMVEGEPQQWTLGVDLYRTFLEIDCVAPYAFMSAFVPGMLKTGWGRIINISTSVETMLRFWPYGSAKAALDAQTAVLATQLVGSGVTANILGPGAFVKPAPINLDDGTVVTPDFGPEIMEDPVVWLASERSAEVNGMRIAAAHWITGISGEEQPAGAIFPIDWTKSA